MSKHTALFHRDYRQYSGGHQKVYDYFGHFLAHPDWQAELAWSESSQPLADTIWAGRADRCKTSYRPERADLQFLAGTDWQVYLPRRPEPEMPVLNLVQHVRHADPDADVYPFLSERAIRICVSQEVEAAILATGRVNGPTFTIANGIDLDNLLARRRDPAPHSVYILGNKQPELAANLASSLQAQGLTVTCHPGHQPRETVLAAMAAAEIAVLLPHATEGFYLPALEAMALCRLVVVPDCVGNRGFCRDGETCLQPSLELHSLLDAVARAQQILGGQAATDMRERARQQLQVHTLERERAALFELLDELESLW